MHLSDQEVDRLCELNASTIKLYLVAKRFSPVFVPFATLAMRAHVSGDRARVELAELVSRGWLRREVQGFGYNRRVRYVTLEDDRPRSGETIAGDRERRSPAIGRDDRQRSGETIAGDQKRSPTIGEDDRRRSPDTYGRARASDPDPTGEVVSTRSGRPSGGGSGEATDGRTDGEKFANARPELVGSIAEAWDLQRTVVAHCLGRFFAQLGALSSSSRPTEREIGEYLRAALLHREQRRTHPAFVQIPFERFFGIACTLERFERWQRSKPPLAPARVELTCTTCGHTQRGVLKSTTRAVACRNCNARIEIAPSEELAIAELVKRAGGSEA